MTRLGLIQMQVGADSRENLRAAEQGIRAAAADGADIVCLPELFRTPYFCQIEEHTFFDLAESVPGPTTTSLGTLAAELGVVVVASVFERRAAGVYHNTSVVLDSDGSLAGSYRKMHLPDDPRYYEKFYFAPGDLGFSSIRTKSAAIAPLVCWDQWFPEAARLAALDGAEIIAYPTAIGWHPGERERFGAVQADAWKTIQRGHAIANGVFVVAVNRVGAETEDPEGIVFWGSSFVCDPFGAVLGALPSDSPGVLVVEIDLAQIEETRRHWPFLRDRRVDAYGGIVARFGNR
ncbi:MAG: carbon-nitrogen hydrolase [Pseudomonadota bacterium]